MEVIGLPMSGLKERFISRTETNFKGSGKATVTFGGYVDSTQEKKERPQCR